MNQQPPAPRAALLARCSSEANVCNQVLILRKEAAGNYLVEEDDVYGDHIGGASALSERPELSRLIQHIEAGTKAYAVVLVQDRSRIGRTPGQVQEVLDRFSRNGVAVRFLQD